MRLSTLIGSVSGGHGSGEYVKEKIGAETATGRWEIARSHAYVVTPQRTSDVAVPPNGGLLRLDPDLRTKLGNVLAEITQRNCTSIDMRSGGAAPTGDIRGRLRDYAFGVGAQIASGGRNLGAALGNAMDRRSSTGLLLLVVETRPDDEDRRRLTVLLFPQVEDQFRFQPARDAMPEAVLEVLDNVFAAGSKLRKIARFDGKREEETVFADGEVVDFQAGAATKVVADYWTDRFLNADIRLDGDHGTLMFAEGLKAAHLAARPGPERNDIVAAARFAAGAQTKSWSVEDFAKEHIPARVREAFLNAAPTEGARRARFTFDNRALRDKLKYRVFELENGVIVHVPVEQVDDTVSLDLVDKQWILRCTGTVVHEHFGSSSRKT